MATLNWIGKEAVVNHDKEVPFKLLEKVSSASVGKESKNLIIHGDNLEALKALMPFYKGKVKCIYIDPPYNTGNEGWVYNDKVNSPKIREWLKKVVGSEGEDLTRHDKWLCMMYPRLKLLRELMRDDGVIFISIDDNEQHYLRILLDEIFGHSNFLANILWQKRTSPDSRVILGGAHDFVVAYAKKLDVAKSTLNKLSLSESHRLSFKNPDNDPLGSWVSSDFTAQGYRPNQMYSITTPSGVTYTPPEGRCWKNIEEVYKKLHSEGRMWYGKDGKGMPRRKTYLSERDGRVPWTWWDNEEFGNNQEARKELIDIFDSPTAFDTPKPVKLISKIIEISTSKNDIVLDSFSGSGTTAHSVMSVNSNDGGNRQFILVEMEDKIAKDITSKRVALAIQKYGYKDGFEFCELAKALFDEKGQINELCTYDELALYVYFTETQSNLVKKGIRSPLLGESNGIFYYLLYKGKGKNDLTRATLAKLKISAPAVIYADRCLVDEEELQAKGITFKQIPYEIKLY